MEEVSEEAGRLSFNGYSLMDNVLEEVGRFFFIGDNKVEEGRLSYVGDSMTINLWPVTAFGGVVVMCE